MNGPRVVCEKCGAPAVVHIGHDPEYGNVIRHFCLGCADAIHAAAVRPRRTLDHAAVAICAGLIVMLLSIFADVLRFGQASGFGWKQDVGMVLGAFTVFLGMLFRIPTVLVVGLQAIALSVLADWLDFGHGEGFGGQQMLGTALGVLITVFGIALALRRGRRKG